MKTFTPGKKMLISAVALMMLSTSVYAQVIVNGYAKVNAVAGAILNVSLANESGGSFEDGDKVIIMQMQDDVIGGNVFNNASFGDIGGIQSAGLYEVAEISSRTESAGLPNTITLTGPLQNVYNTGTNSSLQIITYPQFGTPDYTTTSDISALPWNGEIGGVVAFEVKGVLTLAHNIEVNGAGFRGANPNFGGSIGCSGGGPFRVPTGNNHADKGEGIYRVTDVNLAAGKGKIINGAGGGNSHNGGGGGGSNFSAGGAGGSGWPNCNPSAGGLGGIDLSSYIASHRIFLGGGGGAGEGNNNGSQFGGNGAGIILIEALEVTTSGANPLSITANGLSVTNGSGNDGNSGGGAGGSIVLEVDKWTVNSNAPLTIEANGGNGGHVTHGAPHGGGGGGGMGTVIYSVDMPTQFVTTNTEVGLGGRNCNTCPTTDNGSGSNQDGVIDRANSPLPIELIDFSATAEDDYVRISWSTAIEINNDYFNIERSTDGIEWQEISRVEGAGTSDWYTEYEQYDFAPLAGTSYYRLKQTDFDGTFSYSAIDAVKFAPIGLSVLHSKVEVYPNPATDLINVNLDEVSEYFISMYNVIGQIVYAEAVSGGNIHTIATSDLEHGSYMLEVNSGDQKEIIKVVIR